jgi:formylglycine-generating enzyme required for sulfatase activity
MGSDTGVDSDARDIEQPQHILYLPDYYIARTPVTNAQYRAFVQATECQPPEQWKSGTPPKGKGDHPVTWISWHDAVAYCEWLAEVTRRPYRLPSEAEWEKAARGTDGRLYPWGDEWDAERCNTLETGCEGTTPVSAYEGLGESPYGCVDMAGNVWEWTGSLYDTYPYGPADGREELDARGRRVVRGGSFLNSRVLARCAYRPAYFPGDRRSYGCRVARSPSPPSGP